MLLPAVPAKEGRVQPCVGVLRIEALTVERDPPLARAPQGRIDVTRAGNEAVELEGEKRPLAGAAALARRAAHHDQHRLKLRPAPRLIAPGLGREALCGF